MRILGITKLRNFPIRPKTMFLTYFDFKLGRERPNFDVPPLGRDIRVTDLNGNPICIDRRKVRRGRFRLVYKKITLLEQKVQAFRMLDDCFCILEQVSESLTF